MSSRTTDEAWARPPAHPRVAAGEVHLWLAALDLSDDQLLPLEARLTVDERARATEFRLARHQRQFVIARAALRSILGAYLGRGARELRFVLGRRGKPSLEPSQNLLGLRFNLAHAGQLALYAVTRGREVGVDIEHVRPRPYVERIAEHFFSAAEVAALRAVPTAYRLEAFFNGWTRKEAYIKALGEGLAIPLDQFDVTLTPGEPARLLASRVDPDDPGRWSMHALTPAPGYVAAVLIEGPPPTICTWTWTSDAQASGLGPREHTRTRALRPET